MYDDSVTIYSPYEEDNSSVLLDAGLGFADFFLLYYLLTAPAPFLLLFLSLLTVLYFDNIFDVDSMFDVNSPPEEETAFV